MTRRLILLRHAKSSWKTSGPDHDRPLNARGRKSADAIGNWLRMAGHLPDQILCSTSRRTVETCTRLGLDVVPELRGELFHAEPEEMLACLKQAEGRCVMMIGHNPGIGAFAGRLVTSPPAHDRFDDYPTGATAVIGFDLSSWNRVAVGTGHIVVFTVPRDLL
ncbi:phosphohistidine phosphatase [Salinihabitans flavidus]|uniref:Phosphohistidine phosphatase n=1 Tax=Salinihabitans flavidus TaxID=569882 RepID=A0A1H8VJ17_9RHOB|nr:histidine phosphatase family protein [Salinihabitans flavidus]SEP15442.1 phosphohistidine phosphatase [Salinihabitans flavidus]